MLVVGDSKHEFRPKVKKEIDLQPVAKKDRAIGEGSGAEGKLPDRASVVTGRERTLYKRWRDRCGLPWRKKFADRSQSLREEGHRRGFRISTGSRISRSSNGMKRRRRGAAGTHPSLLRTKMI